MAYRAPSPFAPENQPYRAHSPAPPTNQILPGSITYTTSTSPDGRMIYHPFKAVPASYQTPNGIVSGIQWIPAEATEILPQGAQPATAEFAASWNRGYLSRGDQKTLEKWQKDEEKRRRKEEKEASKRMKDRDSPSDLQKARAMDAMARERRKSFNAGAASPMAFPTSVSPSSGYSNVYGPPASTTGVYDRDRYARERKYSNSGAGGLDRQLGDMDLERERLEQIQYAERERKLSSSALGRPRKYSISDPDRNRKISGGLGERPAIYGGAGAYTPSGAGPYVNPRPYPAAAAPNPAPGPPYAGASPNMRPTSPYAPGAATVTGYPAPAYPPPSPRPGADPYPRSTSPFVGPASGVYPPGHVMAGQSMVQGQGVPPRSRATTPIPGTGSAVPGGYAAFPQAEIPRSPRIPNPVTFPSEPTRLAAPEGFSRPINAAQSFTPFDTMKLVDLEEILEHMPRMPLVLQTHDVLLEDWVRMTQDLALAWSGRLPLPGNNVPKRTTLAVDLIDLWNASFFLARGAELVLYKGRERLSGKFAGTVDRHLPGYDDDDDESDSSSSSSSSSGSDDDAYASQYGMYGRQGAPIEVLEARRRRKEKKADRRRRRKERRARRKAKAKSKNYALYLTCVPLGGHGAVAGPPVASLPGGGSSYPGMMGAPSPHISQGLGMGY